MDSLPILLFPHPSAATPHPRGGGPTGVRLPLPERQAERLLPRFQRLQDALAERRLEMQPVLPVAEPELVLVLETVGSVSDFRNAVAKVEGLEWLADSDGFGVDPDDDFHDPADLSRTLTGVLYLVSSNETGLAQLLSLWHRWHVADGAAQFPHGLARWGQVFSQLHELRPWGPEDRLRETGLAQIWQERVSLGEETVPVEIELWFRSADAARADAVARLSGLVAEAGGTIVSSCCISEVSYQALLAELPIQEVGRVLSLDAAVVRCNEVMFIRPTGQVLCPAGDDDTGEGIHARTTLAGVAGPPAVALLDGLPLENHDMLSGRLRVDDPDGWSADYPVADRVHGTAMASLIAHGDLSYGEAAIGTPIYVRPIMRPQPWLSAPRPEHIPLATLPVDLVHRAVRRMAANDQPDGPAAPTVRVVNLSVGDAARPLDRLMSPWARLLDWLAYEHRLLFVVSAGNHYDLELDCARDEVVKLGAEQLGTQVLDALRASRLVRRILSPAESLNAITVGATHADGAGLVPTLGAGDVNPFDGGCMPSPVSAMGPGFLRTRKPDVSAPGGRVLYRLAPTGPEAHLTCVAAMRAPGQLAAAPGTREGDTGKLCYTRGTSNAAAHVTRLAGQLHEVLGRIADDGGNHEITSRDYEAVIIKALCVHSASWDAAGGAFATAGIADPHSLFGYGAVDPGRVLGCTERRVTLLGWGALSDGTAHIYGLPVPTGLSGVRGLRRLTVTLAWFSPIHPNHQRYRKAALWFSPYGTARDQDHQHLLGTTRLVGDWHAARRGTVQHEVFEGSGAVPVGEDALQLQVNCKGDAGRLEQEVPYGLAVTLEVAEEIGIGIYEEIASRIRPTVQVAPLPAVG